MTKEELKEIRFLDERINSKLRQLEELKAMKGAVCGIDYSRDKIQTSPSNSQEDLIIKITDLELEINKDIDKLVDMKNKAREEINRLSGVHGAILELRYIECKDWDEISYRLNFSEREIYRKHREALKKIIN